MQRTTDSWLPRRGVAAALALVVLAASCGGASSPNTIETSAAQNPADAAEIATTAPVETQTETAPAPPAPVETQTETAAVPAQVAIQLPSVDVVSLATGQTANLNSFSKPGPTLVWFWAPH